MTDRLREILRPVVDGRRVTTPADTRSLMDELVDALTEAGCVLPPPACGDEHYVTGERCALTSGHDGEHQGPWQQGERYRIATGWGGAK